MRRNIKISDLARTLDELSTVTDDQASTTLCFAIRASQVGRFCADVQMPTLRARRFRRVRVFSYVVTLRRRSNTSAPRSSSTNCTKPVIFVSARTYNRRSVCIAHVMRWLLV